LTSSLRSGGSFICNCVAELGIQQSEPTGSSVVSSSTPPEEPLIATLAAFAIIYVQGSPPIKTLRRREKRLKALSEKKSMCFILL
jgi:hypothetical protein